MIAGGVVALAQELIEWRGRATMQRWLLVSMITAMNMGYGAQGELDEISLV